MSVGALIESCFEQAHNSACRGPSSFLVLLQAVYAYTTAIEDPRLDDVWRLWKNPMDNPLPGPANLAWMMEFLKEK